MSEKCEHVNIHQPDKNDLIAHNLWEQFIYGMIWVFHLAHFLADNMEGDQYCNQSPGCDVHLTVNFHIHILFLTF